jgi:hypothetical protein
MKKFRSVWNQAWFSSLRSASGVYRYARRTNNKELCKAILTKELALAFPQQDGLFSSVIATPMETIEVNGQSLTGQRDGITITEIQIVILQKPGGMQQMPYHILDMSWTAYLFMLTMNWKDERLINTLPAMLID